MGICVSCRRRDLQAPDKRAGGAGGGRVPAKGAAAELLPRRADPAMANSISNIKMTNPIKGIVSKRRKRYIKDGFNLDLAYITDRLIAMGFPAEKLEGVYRNHIDEVYRFLEQMHKDHYKIYNLCSERCYDSSKFHGRVARYAFEDHTPPKMELIQPFCEDVHKWLSADARNVAAVHCKAGKGRTGTMVCCYLLYSGQKATADEALKFYGTKRTHDEKGVTIPSQRRYVEYYAALVGGGLQYSATKLHIRELLMAPPPALNGGQCTLELTVSQAAPPLKGGSACQEGRRQDTVRLVLEQCTPLQGDVRVDVYNKPKMMMRKEKLFHFWFNTFFVANCVGAVRVPPPADSMNLETFKLTLNKWQLDDAHKDKQHKLYSPDFKVEVVVQQQPASSRFSACARAASPALSSADSEPELDEHWDSGELSPSACRLQRLPGHFACPTELTEENIPNRCSPSSLTDENIPSKCGAPDVFLERYMRLSDTSSSDCSKFSDRSPSVRYGSLTPSECSTMSTTRLLDANDRKIAYAILSTDTEMPCDVCVRNDKPCRFENKPSDPADTLKYFEHTDVCMQSIAEHDAKKCDAPGKFTKDGYMLIDRSPRPQNQLIRLSDPSHSKLTFGANKCTRLSDPTGKSKCLGAMGTVTKDGYMLVDATPRQPNVKMDRSRLPTTSTDAMLSEATNRIPERSEEYMEFTATDGYMRALETGPAYKEEYAFICSDSDAQPDCDDRKCKLVEMSESKSDDSSEGNLPYSAQGHESKGTNKKHSFFKRDEYKNDKGKIPKVSSDHTISDDSKKKYMFFYKRDEEGSKPRLTLGDIRGSWREFSGKWSDNRKKKDRDDS